MLVTGGAGFIGSHLVDALLEQPGARVTVLDRLSTGGSRMNLAQHAGDPRLSFVLGDVNDAALVHDLVAAADAVVHAAAESHVDRSIDDPRAFLQTNLMGTQTVLEAVRALAAAHADDLHGRGLRPGRSSDGGLFDEDHALQPRSPYAASKASADLLCQAYVTTYAADVTVVRGTNAFGPRQIERVVPTYAVCALEGRPVPVYGDGAQRREFLHVEDWVRGAIAVLGTGPRGVVHNIGDGLRAGERGPRARGSARRRAPTPRSSRTFADRPGHDFRYGVKTDRLLALGWRPRIAFDDGLAATVAWYRDHLGWLRRAHAADVVTMPRIVEAAG